MQPQKTILESYYLKSTVHRLMFFPCNIIHNKVNIEKLIIVIKDLFIFSFNIYCSIILKHMHFTLQLLYHEVYSRLHKSVGSIWDQVLDEKGCLQRIKNVCTEQYKPICIVVYTSPMPSSYTLVINFLVCMVSIYFLNTRPLQQKNLLNILLMGSLILLSSSSFFISIISYIWNHELKVFVPLCIFYP